MISEERTTRVSITSVSISLASTDLGVSDVDVDVLVSLAALLPAHHFHCRLSQSALRRAVAVSRPPAYHHRVLATGQQGHQISVKLTL